MSRKVQDTPNLTGELPHCFIWRAGTQSLEMIRQRKTSSSDSFGQLREGGDMVAARIHWAYVEAILITSLQELV
jgi:hypothetical protein